MPKISVYFNKKDGSKRGCFLQNKTRIVNRIKRESFKTCYIFVDYGEGVGLHGKKEYFTNSGTYHNKEDAIYMLKAFLE